MHKSIISLNSGFLNPNPLQMNTRPYYRAWGRWDNFIRS